jgi:hypothetical protein
MAQEIVTCMIIATAIGLTVYKSYRKLARPKKNNIPGGNGITPEKQFACPDCTAECVLRHAAPEIKIESVQLCARTIEKIKYS